MHDFRVTKMPTQSHSMLARVLLTSSTLRYTYLSIMTLYYCHDLVPSQNETHECWVHSPWRLMQITIPLFGKILLSRWTGVSSRVTSHSQTALAFGRSPYRFPDSETALPLLPSLSQQDLEAPDEEEQPHASALHDTYYMQGTGTDTLLRVKPENH